MSVIEQALGLETNSNDAFDAAISARLSGESTPAPAEGQAGTEQPQGAPPPAAEHGAEGERADAPAGGAAAPGAGTAEAGAEAGAEGEQPAGEAAEQPAEGTAAEGEQQQEEQPAGYDVVGAFREIHPATAAETPEAVIEEVRTLFEQTATERERIGRFDAITEDPATEAFLRARLAGRTAEEAAAEAGLVENGPDPDEDPQAYAQWFAQREIQKREAAARQREQAAAAERQQANQRRAQEMGERFLAAVPEADRTFLQERARVVLFGDELNPPRVDLLLDALRKQRDFDTLKAERDQLAAQIEALKKPAASAAPAPGAQPGAAPAGGASRAPMPNPRGGAPAPAAPADPQRQAFRDSLRRERLEFE